MFITMPSVYWSPPSQPGGTTSGQRPGPSFFEKSTAIPPAVIVTDRIAEVIGQLATFAGELRIVAFDSGIMSLACGGFGVGVGVGVGLELLLNRMFSDPLNGPWHVELPV